MVANTFFFTLVPDLINHQNVGRIKFDVCYIRYYASYGFLITYFFKKKAVSKLYCILICRCYADDNTLLVY